MKHTVTYTNPMLGEHTIRFDSRAKTDDGLLRAASARIAQEIGGYSSVMSALTQMVAVDNRLVEYDHKVVTKEEAVSQMRRKRSYVRDCLGDLSWEIARLQGEVIVMESEYEKLCSDIAKFDE